MKKLCGTISGKYQIKFAQESQKKGSFEVKLVRGRKLIATISVKEETAKLQEGKSCGAQTFCKRRKARYLDISASTIRTIL